MPRGKIAPRGRYRPAVASSPLFSSATTSATANSNLTLSKAYQSNILLYQFQAKYCQKVFLERNFNKFLKVQKGLIKDLKEGDGRNGRAVDSPDTRGGIGARKRKFEEALSRFQPEISEPVLEDREESVMFGVLPQFITITENAPRSSLVQRMGLGDSGRDSSQLGYTLKAKLDGVQENDEADGSISDRAIELYRSKWRLASVSPDEDNGEILRLRLREPLELPLSEFFQDDGNTYSNYRLTLSMVPVDSDSQHSLPNGDSEGSFKGLVAKFFLDSDLKSLHGDGDVSLPMEDPEFPGNRTGISLNVAHGWSKIYNCLEPPDTNGQEREKRITNVPTSTADVNKNKLSRPQKRRKTTVDYMFHGSVKGFDESKSVNNNKIYTFSCTTGYTCIFCGNQTSFKSMDRLRFHLRNNHLYLNFTLDDYEVDRFKEHARIKVDSAVISSGSKPTANAVNQRKYVWVAPTLTGWSRKPFDLRAYVEGDDSWVKAALPSEGEKKLWMGKGKIAERKRIAPPLVNDGVAKKRRVVLPDRGDGKGYVNWRTKVMMKEGEEVSESDEEEDEEIHAARLDAADISQEAKQLMRVWTKHIRKEQPASARHLPNCLIRFCRNYKVLLQDEAIKAEFRKLASELLERRVVDFRSVSECLNIINDKPDILQISGVDDSTDE